MANLDVSNLEAFIFDLDGVIWRGDKAIEGSVEAISRFQAAGKRCTYCTNNASSTPADYVEKLASMGITAEEEDVMTSALATALYLSSQLTGQFSAYVVGEDGLVSTLRKTGARVVTMQGMNPGTNDIIEDTAFPVDCVIAGIDRSFNYDKLRLAQRFILNGARFIATNRDATFPVPDGVVPGAGAIVSAIETASGVAPLTIGKPQALMPMLLMQKFDLKAETTAFVGDRLDTDMVAAHRASMPAIFVTTGISTREAAERARGQQKPDAIFTDLAELCRSVLGASRPATSVLENDILPAFDEASPAKAPTTSSATPETARETADAFAPDAASNVANSNGALSFSGAAANGAIANGVATNGAAANGATANGTSPGSAISDVFTFPNEQPDAPPLQESPTDDEKTVVSESARPVSPLANLLDEDEPKGIEVDPAPSPFSFSLEDDAGGAITPRPAPHLASPGLTKSSEKASSAGQAPAGTVSAGKADGEAVEKATGKVITPGTKNKEVDVSEGLDNWWESIEDAFKKG